MEIKANSNYLRVAPRKVRLVADLVRGMDVKEAETQLGFTPKRASASLLKLLKSAIANAKNNFHIEKDGLYIKKLSVNEGPPFKRWRPVSRGRAVPIMRRSSHVNLVLDVKPSFAKATEGKAGVKVDKKPVAAKTQKETKTQKDLASLRRAEGEFSDLAVARKASKKPKTRAPKEIKKGKEGKGLFKKVFRRKSF